MIQYWHWNAEVEKVSCGIVTNAQIEPHRSGLKSKAYEIALYSLKLAAVPGGFHFACLDGGRWVEHVGKISEWLAQAICCEGRGQGTDQKQDHWQPHMSESMGAPGSYNVKIHRRAVARAKKQLNKNAKRAVSRSGFIPTEEFV